MTNDGGPAFPQNDATVNRINNHDGMSLRDYFATEALSGWLATYGDAGHPASMNDGGKHLANVALWSYRTADAMLSARSVLDPQVTGSLLAACRAALADGPHNASNGLSSKVVDRLRLAIAEADGGAQ